MPTGPIQKNCFISVTLCTLEPRYFKIQRKVVVENSVCFVSAAQLLATLAIANPFLDEVWQNGGKHASNGRGRGVGA